MSPEEFFMYLTIGLIVLVPLTARLYRYVTMKHTKQMIARELGSSAADRSGGEGKA